MYFAIEWLCLALMAIKLVNGYPNGAPEQVCKTLIPGHKAVPQTGQSPYQVSANVEKSPNGGVEVKVIINSPEGTAFRGFVIQARMATDHNNTVNGKFKVIDEQNSHAVSCDAGQNNTLTHSNRNDKHVITAKWLPPDHFDKEVVFMASIVKNVKTFWINQSSKTISVNYRSIGQDSATHESAHHENANTQSHSSGGSGDKLLNSSSMIYSNFLTIISVISLLFIYCN